MDIKEIKEGQGIVYDAGCGCGDVFAVVLSVGAKCISVAPVQVIELGDKCYDDEGAIKEKHKDNVRLKDCPPPFSQLYEQASNGVYCYADMDNLIHIKESEFASINLEIVDNGAVITEHMMEEIKNHPWQEQLQKQKVRSVEQLTNLLHVDNSMIQKTKQDGLKAVTIGLRNADGKEKVGAIFVGEKQVNADKKTAELPKSQQKSYVALDISRDYTFSMKGPRDGEGKPTCVGEKISGADIIKQNKAYNRNKTEQRAQSLADSVKSPEAEEQIQAGD